jgi:hypothetical protein
VVQSIKSTTTTLHIKAEVFSPEFQTSHAYYRCFTHLLDWFASLIASCFLAGGVCFARLLD